MSFRPVLQEDALWDGEMMPVNVDGVAVLLVRIDGAVHAYRDACAHKGMPLSRGSLARGVLTCSVHHWQYDAATGGGINPANARLCRLPVRVRNDLIEVDACPGSAADSRCPMPAS
ncbi:MAG TPA: Rieske 2Fe-2S domain-containing protein [Burkholderiaceae bacterium]|nr:Rieske 2Fe-2S domain-containing protein [Burkholderiaceae bacterium]